MQQKLPVPHDFVTMRGMSADALMSGPSALQTRGWLAVLSAFIVDISQYCLCSVSGAWFRDPWPQRWYFQVPQ